MGRYILRRLLQMIPVFLGTTFLMCQPIGIINPPRL